MGVFDRVVSVIVALVLLVIGVLVPIEVVHTLLGKDGHLLVPYDSITRFGTDNAWSSTIVLTISIVLVVVGLVLLLLELKKRRPGLLTVQPITDGVVSGMSRRSLSRAAGNQAEQVEGISDASVTVGRKTIKVDVSTGQQDPGDLEERVRTHLSTWLDTLQLARPLTLRTRLVSGKD